MVGARTTAFRFDDPDEYVHGTPYETLARLRRETPFVWQPALDDPAQGFWLALAHEDVVSISNRPQLFATSAPLLGDPLPPDLWPMFPALTMIADNLMTYHHEKHSVFRPVANTLFSPARLAETEAEVRTICAEVLDDALARPSFDFADDIALAIPVRAVLGTIIGVPSQDLMTVARTILTINAMDDPAFRPTTKSLAVAADTLRNYGLTMLERLQRAPDCSVLSELVRCRHVEGVSTAQLFFAYWFPLAAGAFDTTASTIAGGVRALLEFPEQLERLTAQPDLVPLAIEEMLRWVSPVVYFRRTALADATIRGQAIAKGQKVVLCYASANRDDTVFAEPDSFDAARSPNNHVSLGHGPHFCLGARTARFVIRIFLEEFLRRKPRLQLDGEVVHTRSNWMNRIRSLPVRSNGQM